MPAQVEVSPLGPECDNFSPASSEQIYYYEFPYKVTLKNHIDPNDSRLERRRDKVMRRLMLEEFTENELVYTCRFYVSDHHQRVYLRHYNDVKTFIQFFHTEIEQIHGPRNQAHVDLLYQDDIFCTARNPYYGKFDIKVFVTTQIERVEFGHSLVNIPTTNIKQRRETVSEIKQFLSDNIPDEDKHWQIDLYTKMDILLDLMPFIKLQYPTARLIITKCIPK